MSDRITIGNQPPCITHGWMYSDSCTECAYIVGYHPYHPMPARHQSCRPMDTSKLDLTPPQVPARKDDAGKPDMTLITYSMLEPAAKILKFGEKKYGRLNYRNPNPGFEQRLIAATLRHLLQHTDGQELDSESNELHLAHALTTLMLIFDRRAHKKEGEEL